MDKLDPHLRSLMESSGARESEQPVQVMIGLSAPATDAELQNLRERGLQVHSVIGDVLTGSAALSTIPRIAEHALIVRIEASTPVYPEGA
jgi:hypothetical protein